MNKQTFLARLEEGLSGLPENDISERLAFYGEMIDDRVEEGLSEEAAVAQIGSVDEIVEQTVEEVPLTKLIKNRVRPNRSLRAGEIVLLVLGSPVWFSLLITVCAVLLSIYIVIWALLLSLWAVDAACAVASIGALAAGVLCVREGDGLQGLAIIGAGLALAGLSILLLFGCRTVTAAVLHMTKKTALYVKSRWIRKESAR